MKLNLLTLVSGSAMLIGTATAFSVFNRGVAQRGLLSAGARRSFQSTPLQMSASPADFIKSELESSDVSKCFDFDVFLRIILFRNVPKFLTHYNVLILILSSACFDPN